MQFKKVLACALTVCLLLSLTVPAYAADDLIYSVDTDADLVYFPRVYYTDGYTPGMYADVDRSLSLFASTRVTYGSYSYYGYVPSGSYTLESGAVRNFVMSDYEPVVNVTSSGISAAQTVPNTTLVYGDSLNVVIPSTADSYFDFSGSTLLYEQSDALANTFILNGTLRFKLSNLWSFTSNSAEHSDVTFYRASDPLAVQLLVNGKPYGDIIDVTSYTSPFTAATSGNPAFTSVTFDNFKVYYNGDTPELIGFRVYTGSAYGSYTYSYGSYLVTTLQNLLSLQWSEQPDISFVQEGGDGYAGDLSVISSLLSAISGKLSDISTQLSSGLNPVYTQLSNIFNRLSGVVGWGYLSGDGSVGKLDVNMSLSGLVVNGFLGLRSLMVDSSGVTFLSRISSFLSNQNVNGLEFLGPLGNLSSTTGTLSLLNVNRVGFLGLAQKFTDLLSTQSDSGVEFLGPLGAVSSTSGRLSILNTARVGFLGLATLQNKARSYMADTVFPWQSYNMETHQLNAATNITGQNNLFFTAFQSIEDKLGRLAYVFGSDEDLALKDAADPGTDSFRENFGGGLSLGQISDSADVVAGVDGLFDSGYDFGDAFTEISGESMFAMWFSADNAAAVDSTGSVMALDDSDPYNMQIYFDRLQEVAEKRDWGSD